MIIINVLYYQCILVTLPTTVIKEKYRQHLNKMKLVRSIWKKGRGGGARIVNTRFHMYRHCKDQTCVFFYPYIAYYIQHLCRYLLA